MASGLHPAPRAAGNSSKGRLSAATRNDIGRRPSLLRRSPRWNRRGVPVSSTGLCAQGSAEITNLVVNVRLRLDGFRNLLAKEGSITRPEMVQQAFDCQLRPS